MDCWGHGRGKEWVGRKDGWEGMNEAIDGNVDVFDWFERWMFFVTRFVTLKEDKKYTKIFLIPA